MSTYRKIDDGGELLVTEVISEQPMTYRLCPACHSSNIGSYKMKDWKCFDCDWKVTYHVATDLNTNQTLAGVIRSD
jgi:ribosomal protein L37AE/L43A